MPPVLMLFATVLLVIYSNVMLKARMNVFEAADRKRGVTHFFITILSDPLIWSSFVATAIAMTLYLLALRRIDLSVAQPTLAIVFVAVPVCSALFLGEHLPVLRLSGLGCIALGVLLVLKSTS